MWMTSFSKIAGNSFLYMAIFFPHMDIFLKTHDNFNYFGMASGAFTGNLTPSNIRQIRLVITRAGAWALPPVLGREAGGSGARRERRAMDPSPGGSGRYRPALARVGGGGRATGGREAGGAMARRGGRRAVADVASSDSSVK
jgi:hypothetical protein